MPESSVVESTTNLNEDVSLLNEDLPEKPSGSEELPERPKSEPKVEDTKLDDTEEDDQEEEEDEYEPEDPEPEDKASEGYHPRPTMSQIKEKYPNLFKDFPALRDDYYRAQEFAKVFPTVDDAREAAEDAAAFSELRDEVLKGSSAKFFEAVKATDEKALARIADTLLPSLSKISPDLHWRAVTPILEHVVRNFFQEGERYGNEDLKNAALHLSNFLFSDFGVAQGTKSFIPKQEKTTDPEREKFEQERDQFRNEQRGTFTTVVRGEMLSGLKSEILARGEHNRLKIDPDGVFTPFVRDSITDRIIQEVGSALEADKEHINFMNSLWSKASKSGFTGDHKSRIINAYLARAKSLVPAIRNRLVSEALGSSALTSGNKKAKAAVASARREPGSGGKVSNGAPKVIDPKSVDWSRTSDDDILNDRVTYRK